VLHDRERRHHEAERAAGRVAPRARHLVVDLAVLEVREIERERVTVDVVKGLIPVLDDLDRAEKHGDLAADTAFSTIAAKLRTSVERLGVKPFGAVGEPFDPTVHEAIFQLPTPEVTVDTVGDVVETGYFLGSTLLRVAKVVVQVPSDG